MKKHRNGDYSNGINAKKSDVRFRVMFRFWLDITDDLQAAIADELEHLKTRRQFAPTIRAALRLFFSLRDGDTSVLRELFPGIVASLQTPQPAPTPAIEQQLERLEQLMLKQGAVPMPIPTPQAPSASAGPRALSVPTFDAPSPDEDDTVEFELKRDTSTASAQNFIASMLALQT